MSSRHNFTGGFEGLYVGEHIRKLDKKNNAAGHMFGQKSKLSKSTRDLVERMAKQSGLSRDQMKRLGKLHSAAPKIGHSNKSRQNGARGSRTVPGRLKLKSRPGRKTQRDIAAQMKQEIYVDPAKLAETDALAIEMSRRRAKSKHRLQHSYLTGLRIGGLDGQIGVQKQGYTTSIVTEAPRCAPQVTAKKLQPSELFSQVTKEIDERERHMKELRSMGSLSRIKELEIKEEIALRIRELKTLDRLMGDD